MLFLMKCVLYESVVDAAVVVNLVNIVAFGLYESVVDAAVVVNLVNIVAFGL